MPELVPMPKLGFDMAEGILVRKVKKDGETVAKGEVLAEIETDKATVEVESSASGVVKGWLADEGQPVPVGANMVVIGAPDEQVDLDALRSGGAPKAAPTTPVTPAPSTPSIPSVQREAVQSVPSVDQPSGRVVASPIARRMADEANIDIRLVTGTGPGGRITKKDIEAFLRSGKPATPAVTPSRPSAQPAPSVEDTLVPLTKMRQIIARRMTESKQTVPQFYVTTEIDMEAALGFRQQVNALLPDERKVSVNDLVVKAAALALRQFPNLNASFAGDKVIRKGHVNVGIAVAVEGGLLTVVVRDADQKPLAQIAAEAKAMIGRARQGKVQGPDIEGSTFSVSNLGMYDVDHFIAIINPPEAAILAVGSTRAAPVVRNGVLVPGQRLKATCSADHRVTDGAEVAQFMQAVKKSLEEPLRLVV